MFGKLSKNTAGVSHKIFHNLQIPMLCAFISITPGPAYCQTSWIAVYRKVTLAVGCS